jgi:2-polyprenyl-3-methyl-5-hydroxy-6-metoxy-1,4-benzoquinol methylase
MVHPATYAVAQDITQECVNICTWVDKYIVGTVEENYGIIKNEGPFDIISLTHVIEHLNYPVDFLIQIEPLLSEKGILFITAPNQPPGWEKAGNNIDTWQKWSYNHVPAHLQYLRQKSISAIARITGLKILSYDNNHDGGSAFELMLSR